jgi:hypothetical protein
VRGRYALSLVVIGLGALILAPLRPRAFQWGSGVLAGDFAGRRCGPRVRVTASLSHCGKRLSAKSPATPASSKSPVARGLGGRARSSRTTSCYCLPPYKRSALSPFASKPGVAGQRGRGAFRSANGRTVGARTPGGQGSQSLRCRPLSPRAVHVALSLVVIGLGALILAPLRPRAFQWGSGVLAGDFAGRRCGPRVRVTASLSHCGKRLSAKSPATPASSKSPVARGLGGRARSSRTTSCSCLPPYKRSALSPFASKPGVAGQRGRGAFRSANGATIGARTVALSPLCPVRPPVPDSGLGLVRG